jgi:hypothetical protein
MRYGTPNITNLFDAKYLRLIFKDKDVSLVCVPFIENQLEKTKIQKIFYLFHIFVSFIENSKN